MLTQVRESGRAPPSPSPLIPKPVRPHESHPTVISSVVDNPGPGAYTLHDGFDREYFSERGVRKGFSMGGRNKVIGLPGIDSPGPKYDIATSERALVKGGSMSHAPRFGVAEHLKKKKKKMKAEEPPDRRSYTPSLEYSSTCRRPSSVAFRPKGSESKRLPPPLKKDTNTQPRGHAWRQKLKAEEALLREEGLVDDEVHVPQQRTKKKFVSCTFGHRSTASPSLTPGPGAYDSSPPRVSSKSFQYMEGVGHANWFKSSADEAITPLHPKHSAVRPDTPSAIIYLTG